MIGRISFSCALIIRIDYPSVLDEQEIIKSVYDSLADRQIPVIWNLRKGIHVPPADERNILPQGRYGIPHALLRPKELEAELLFQDSAGEDEIREYLFPAVIDPYRESMRSLYRQRGRLFIDAGDKITLIDRERRSEFPLWRLAGGERKSLRRGMKHLKKISRRSGNPAIVLAAPTSAGEVRTMLEDLSHTAEKFRLRWLELDELIEPRNSPETPGHPDLPQTCSGTPLPGDPLSRFRRSIPWGQATEGRLFLLSRNHRSDSAGFTAAEETPRDLISHMPGEVVMQEGAVTADFNAGELAGLQFEGHPLIGPQPALPVFDLAASSVTLSKIGSFSFQDDSIRGLRDRVAINSDIFETPGNLIRDYFFLSGDPRLCISFFITYPRFRDGEHISRYALCEIPLLLLPAGGEIQALCDYPDGEGAEALLRDPGEYLLYGSRFSFPLKEGIVSIEFADYQGVVHELPVSIRDTQKKDSSRLILLNPGGSYTPFRGNLISGLREQFSLVITLNMGPGSDHHNSLPAELLPFLEQYRLSTIGKTSSGKSKSV